MIEPSLETHFDDLSSSVPSIQNGCCKVRFKTGHHPFVAIWMELESIMLSELSQRKTISYGFFHVEFKKTKQMRKREKEDRERETSQETDS